MSDLHALANAISPSSPAIRKFALAVADKLEPPVPPPSSVTHGIFTADSLGWNYASVWDQVRAAVPFTGMYLSPVPTYVAHVQQTGGKVWVNLPASWSDTDAASYAKSVWTDALKPAILAFYIADDTDIDAVKGPAWLAARSALVHNACPGSVTVATHYAPATIAGIVGAVDEIGVDYYPARSDGSFHLDIVKQCVAAAGSRYSIIAGASAAGDVRVPTPSELKQHLDYAGTTAARSVWVYQWDAALAANAGLVSVLKAWV